MNNGIIYWKRKQFYTTLSVTEGHILLWLKIPVSLSGNTYTSDELWGISNKAKLVICELVKNFLKNHNCKVKWPDDPVSHCGIDPYRRDDNTHDMRFWFKAKIGSPEHDLWMCK